jgi:uncharacterized cysteine cluster protein YcgN (CxxCxxCC family)
MSKRQPTNHTQATLTRGSVTQVSWIPSDKAVKGNYVKLRERGGEWEDGWLVSGVGKTLPTETVMERADDYKRTREASDI